MSNPRTQSWFRFLAAIFVGALTWAGIGGLGLFMLRVTWAAYAIAEPTKSYTVPMLLSRLTAGVICTLVAGFVTELIAGRSRAATVYLGVVLLAGSAFIHLGRVWADYPPWYHTAYLLPLLPLTVLGGTLPTRISPIGRGRSTR